MNPTDQINVLLEAKKKHPQHFWCIGVLNGKPCLFVLREPIPTFAAGYVGCAESTKIVDSMERAIRLRTEEIKK